MKYLCATLAVSVLVVSMSGRASAQTKAGVNPASVSTLNCIYNLLRSDESVHSTSVYSVDGFRSAVEFSFRDKKYGDIVADIVLSGGRIGDQMTYNLGRFSTNSPDQLTQDKALRSAEFVGKLLARSCSVTPALDDVLPFPPPRAEWQQVEWPSQPPG
jgi:hypothetical protein